MTTDRVDDALKDLKIVLEVEPSAELSARVRRRVEVVSPARAFWMRTAWAAAGMVVVAGVAAFFFGRPGVSSDPMVKVGVPKEVRPTPGQLAERRRTVELPAEPVRMRGLSPTVRPLEVLVPEDQSAALNQLLRDLGAGRINPADLAVTEPVYVAPAPSPVTAASLSYTTLIISPID